MSLSHVKKFALTVALSIAVIGAVVGGGIGSRTAEAGGFCGGQSFCVHGFRNWNGDWCQGLFNNNGQLLTYWGCYGGFGSQRVR